MQSKINHCDVERRNILNGGGGDQFFNYLPGLLLVSGHAIAFQWLEEAYRQRVFRIIELTFPMFDSLRSDPRWQDLIRRIGLSRLP